MTTYVPFDRDQPFLLRLSLRPTGKSRYKKRQQTVEPVFGIVKSAIGFTRFHLRSIQNVATEWLLVALADNCRRLHRLHQA